MLSFKQYITEAFKFARGRDSDYYGDRNRILLFSDNDAKAYVETGKTHGIQSHALKHLKEFKPETNKQLISVAKTIIKDYVSKGGVCGLYTRGRGFASLDPMDALLKSSDNVITNTLDSINDKYINRRDMTSIERDLYNRVIKEFERAYREEIESRIKMAVDLTKLSSVQDIVNAITKARVIKFTATDRFQQTYYLDFRSNAVIMETTDLVRTAYVYNRQGNDAKSVIRNFLAKLRYGKVDSPSVMQAFRQVTERIDDAIV